MIELRTPKLSEEWTQLDSRVRLVVEAVEELAAGYGLPVVVTSLLRAGNPGSPHAHARAADLSVKHLPERLVREILELRHRFPYGAEGFSSVVLESPKYQDLAVYGWDGTRDRPWLLQNSHATGPHLHIQVPPRETNWPTTLPDEAYEDETGGPLEMPDWPVPDRLVVEPIKRQTITAHLDYIIPTGRLLSAHEILRQPERPAKEDSMQHPERLGWAVSLPDGYYLDEIGQVRHQPTGDLVCGWSGRGHRQYLLPLPVPDPVAGSVRVVWCDKDSMEEFGRMTRRAGRAATSAGLQSIIRRLLGMAFDVLAGRVLR